MNGASGRYVGAVRKLAGMKPVLLARADVVKTIPGRILPYTEPTPGKRSAAPPARGGPIVVVRPGRFGVKNVPVNGNPENGAPCGRKMARVPVPVSKTIAGGLVSVLF